MLNFATYLTAILTLSSYAPSLTATTNKPDLQRILASSVSDRDRGFAALALAQKEEGLSPEAAVNYYTLARELLSFNSDLTTLIDFYIARTLLSTGMTAPALTILSGLQTPSLRPELSQRVMELQISALARVENWQAAIASFKNYQTQFNLQKWNPQTVAIAANALKKQNFDKEYLSLVESLTGLYPTTEESRWAFRELVNRSCADKSYVFPLEILEKLAANSSLDTGISEFIVASLKAPLRLETGAVVELDVGEQISFLTRVRMFEVARLQVDKQLAENGLDGSLLFEAAKIYERLGDGLQAARLFSKFLMEYPGKGPAEIRAKAGLAENMQAMGQNAQAAAIYAQLAKRTHHENYRWGHFWNLYLAEKYGEALTLIDSGSYVPERTNDDVGVRAYWRARTLEKLGRTTESRQMFKDLLESRSDDYYAALVAARNPALGSARSAAIAESLKLPADTVQELNTQPESLAVADTMVKFGLHEPAQFLIRSLIDGGKGAFGRHALTSLAYSVRDYNLAGRAQFRSSAMRTIPRDWWSFAEHQRLFANEWRYYYPIAYPEAVEKAVEAHDTDKYFVLSIMRAESRYNASARSFVGARGLMQIMPYTGAKIARLAGKSDFSTDDLMSPELNINLGALYLRKLLSYYGGNYALAAAAYNAGPTAVDRWLKQCQGCAADEFVESIAFRETRAYVKRVLNNLANYRRIYGGGSGATHFVAPVPTELAASGEMF